MVDDSSKKKTPAQSKSGPTKIPAKPAVPKVVDEAPPSPDEHPVYQRLKEHNVPIDHVSDHGISIGIYFHDLDGNGIEVSYELPRSEWNRHEAIFSGEGRQHGLFPGPWDEYLPTPQTTAG